ncbi:MAG: 16S rRNA (guanine(966)-N(2))-methyltransferase RsmD [Candidatus Syntrophonatronum acetioxidans]|uniref:16S rRNA (Guanine(966)-N(2))-methyltransferase RsmD n=1 Tax=Candidatus Syntrophonatronum acetioxidans TaxID=1795816 RepID=A0A424YHW4_9FIRM|nr:MAG: 16S rRNA (guanine(966)-N(2))-methyltransferase RsmD [Candidatus Syntrophonatronum acetioxidans]
MRVITGKARGRKLKDCPRKEVRPTSQRAKEGIFNKIGPFLEGKVFLDLFAGSGNIGIEAISRGAELCIFIEKNSECVKIIYENLKNTGLNDFARVYRMDVRKGLKEVHKEKILLDYIFMDPPYFKNFYVPVIEKINNYSLLKEKGILVVEHYKSIDLPEKINSLVKGEVKKYGDSWVTYYFKS